MIPHFQPQTSSFQLPARKACGFSLIETVLALGICATGILLLVAMLPLALGSLTEFADRNAHARIKQAISARYAMIDWNVLEEAARDDETETFFFDFAGNELALGDPELAFAAQVAVGGRRTLQGDTGENRYLRMLEIRVTQTPEREDALTNPAYFETLTASLGNEAKLKTIYRD